MVYYKTNSIQFWTELCFQMWTLNLQIQRLIIENYIIFLGDHFSYSFGKNREYLDVCVGKSLIIGKNDEKSMKPTNVFSFSECTFVMSCFEKHI